MCPAAGGAWRAGRGALPTRQTEEAQSLVFRTGRGGMELGEQRRLGGSEMGRTMWSRWKPRGDLLPGEGLWGRWREAGGGVWLCRQAFPAPTSTPSSSHPQETTRARRAAAPWRRAVGRGLRPAQPPSTDFGAGGAQRGPPSLNLSL